MLKPVEVIRILTKLGFEKIRQSGSHVAMASKGTGKLVPVPIHNKDIKRGLLRGIIKEAGLEVEDFLKLL